MPICCCVKRGELGSAPTRMSLAHIASWQAARVAAGEHRAAPSLTTDWRTGRALQNWTVFPLPLEDLSGIAWQPTSPSSGAPAPMSCHCALFAPQSDLMMPCLTPTTSV